MKLRPEQLARALDKGLAPIYLVSGDEPLQVQEALDAIRRAARSQGFSEQTRLASDLNGFDWNELLEEANALSLFADRKLIELPIPNGKPGDKGSKALVAYAANPSPDNLLLIRCPKLEKSSQNSKWFKTLEKTGVVVQIWPLTPAELPNWIRQRLQQAGLNATDEAVLFLADRVEGNLLAAVQEVEKLRLLAPEGQVDLALLEEVITDSARFDVFTLVDNLLKGDAAHGLKILHGLRGEGLDATVVLWALARELRQLSQLARLQQQGQSFGQALKVVAKESRVPEFLLKKRSGLIQAALYRHSERQLRDLVLASAQIDRAIKGQDSLSPWLGLEALSLQLAGVPCISSQSFVNNL